MPTKLLIAIPMPSSYLPGLLRAVNYMEVETKVFNSRGYTLLEKMFIFFKSKRFATKLLNRRLVNIVKEFKPSILLMMKGELISEESLKEINNLGVKTVNWFPDYINAFDLAKKLANIYDYFFHFDPLATRKLKKLKLRAKVYNLPFCSDVLPDDKFLLYDKYNYQISFIGNYYPIREKYLESIADLGLNIWGDQRWASSSLASCYRGYLPNSKFSEISRASKINLNIQHEYPYEGLVLRPFEILSSGAFLLTQNKKDVKKLFKDDVATFSSSDNLRKKVIYFLAHDEERKKMANKGYLAVKAGHTYFHRIRKILSIIR